ncbi:MAG: EamA family transporter, partial [Alphaproteobacteria bacterium]|nr:EamA family transporter [Alphaproteobacteria bacterium]
MNKFSQIGSQGRFYVLLVLVVVFWGVNWPIMKLGIQYLPPLWFAATRIFLGSLFLFAL